MLPTPGGDVSNELQRHKLHTLGGAAESCIAAEAALENPRCDASCTMGLNAKLTLVEYTKVCVIRAFDLITMCFIGMRSNDNA